MLRGDGDLWATKGGARLAAVPASPMKLLIEILLAIFLHPIAFVLCLINIMGRDDLTALQKIVWIAVTLVWGIGPILYILVGDGALW